MLRIIRELKTECYGTRSEKSDFCLCAWKHHGGVRVGPWRMYTTSVTRMAEGEWQLKGTVCSGVQGCRGANRHSLYRLKPNIFQGNGEKGDQNQLSKGLENHAKQIKFDSRRQLWSLEAFEQGLGLMRRCLCIMMGWDPDGHGSKGWTESGQGSCGPDCRNRGPQVGHWP